MKHDSNIALVETNPHTDKLYVPDNAHPEYSENLVFMGWDPIAEVGVYHHFSRMHEDPNVWEGVLTVYEKDGSLLTHRSLGAYGTSEKADCGSLSFAVEEPLQKWRLKFDGLAIRCTTHDAAMGPIAAGNEETLHLDLLFDGTFPTWSAGAAMDDQDWGDTHLEQGGNATGTIKIGDRTINMDFFAFRDHTRGPRNYTGLDKEAWTWGCFPSGRVFLVLDAWQDPDVHVQWGFVVENGKLYPAMPKEVPPLHDAEGAPRKVCIEVSSELGDMKIEGEVLEAMAFTMRAPIGIPLGADWSKPRNTLLVESVTRLQWNGEIGYGWLERFNRAERMTKPVVNDQ